MSPSTQSRLFLGLVVQFLVMGAALAQAPPPDLAALVKLCEAAQTPEQCRSSVPACEQALKVAEQTSHSTDLDNNLLKLWGRLGVCQIQVGQYAQAAEHFRSMQALRVRIHGPEHPDVAESLDDLACVLDYQGRYAEAESMFRQALRMRQKLLGTEHPEVALSLNNLAHVLDSQGKYSEGEPLFRQALSMRQKLLGAEHPDVTISLNNLAMVLDHQGKYAESESLLRHVLAMMKKLQGAEHPQVALSLNNLASVLEHEGKYTEAELLHRQALSMRQKLLGTEHPDLALSQNNLASVLNEQGKYAETEQLLREALAMRQKLLGTEHPDLALTLNNLASLLENQGKYAEAEPLYRQALAMWQKLLRAEHPQVALGLNNLAHVLNNQGKYAESESLFRQALAMVQKLMGAEHPEVATSLSNLAVVLESQGNYAEAEPLFRHALLMGQKLLGAEHPQVALSLNNLAGVLKNQGKYTEAEPLYRRALAMRQKLLGAEHPAVALGMNNLALVLDRREKYAEAEPLHHKALAMWQKLLGTEHPNVATSLNNLAALSLSLSAPAKAVPLLREAAAIREVQLRATVSETRMQALIDKLRSEEDTIYGLLLGPHPPEADTLALSVALLRKGRVADAGSAANSLLHWGLKSPALAKQFQDWQALRAQRERLLYAGPGRLSPSDYQARLRQLKQDAETLEYLLAADLPTLRSLQPPTLDAILAEVAAKLSKLSKQAALVEVLWARPWQAKNPKDPWGAPHYFALLLFPDGRSESVDLGEAAVVDGLSRELLGVLQHPGSQPEKAARALYDQILLPLRSKLGGVTDLYLSLDGTLNLIPFDALHDGTDYLLGRWRFHYLTSGRDLLRKPSRRAPGAALILANPDFGRPDPEPTVNASKGSEQSLYQRLKGLLPLPGTKKEAKALQALLRVQPLMQGAATEQAVRSAEAPRILHMATHGLFLDDVELPVPLELGRGALLDRPRSRIVPTQEIERLPGRSLGMNRSALVLAGVLQGHRGKDTTQDGLLTAEESSSLNLDGTQLVVLSACQTGQGSLSAGQGVYGLRRAFLVAGAETLVTSLWRVSDAATGELMAQYYGKLFDKQQPRDRRGGMIEAMQELRQRPGRSHPYYWAPFLVIGQDGPLRR